MPFSRARAANCAACRTSSSKSRSCGKRSSRKSSNAKCWKARSRTRLKRRLREPRAGCCACAKTKTNPTTHFRSLLNPPLLSSERKAERETMSADAATARDAEAHHHTNLSASYHLAMLVLSLYAIAALTAEAAMRLDPQVRV